MKQIDILKKNGNKYLVCDSTDENRKILEKYQKSIGKIRRIWNRVKNKIKTINGGKEGENGKDFMKIKFDTVDNLPLNKPLKLCMLTIIVRSIFEEDGKFYPQVYLNECFYEL